MEILEKLFLNHGPVQAVIVFSLVIVFGILLGRIRIFSVSFGIGGILFSGIIVGHFGLSLDPKVLIFTREFGLLLFIFGVGMQVGPTFLESLRDQGLKLNLMAIFIVCTGAILAVCCRYIFNLQIPETAGLFSGAVTNTPSLGAANEAWTLVAGSPEAVSTGLQTMSMAYAMAYPFGIFGIILTMMLLKGIFHIDVAKELSSYCSEHSQNTLSLPRQPGAYQTLLVTASQVIGKPLIEMIPAGVEVLGLGRAGADHPFNPQWKLRLEDKVYVANADPELISRLAKALGNKPEALNHPQMLPIFLAIFAGVFLGSIPVTMPGLPTGVKLGVAGGTLLMAIAVSRKQRFAGLTFYMTNSSMQLMREIGILLFLSCVGLNAGAKFVETVLYGQGLLWMGIGAIITFVPLGIAALICRMAWKIKFPTLCGMLAGSMTDPPALAFAIQYYGGEMPMQGYSTVYPLTMILRILAGQLLVLILAGGA